LSVIEPAAIDGAIDVPITDDEPPPVTGRAGWGAWLAGVAVTVAWAAAVWFGPRVAVNPALHRLALFGHLAALVLGFGAVLTVDWFGLLWILGRRNLIDVVRTARGVHVPIWLGLLGLLGTGMFLAPHPGSPLTAVKLVAVLMVAVNGVYVGTLHHRFARYGFNALPRALLVRAVAAGGVSQAAWWTAVVIGFINSSGRH
jgi:hypothetical protein